MYPVQPQPETMIGCLSDRMPWQEHDHVIGYKIC